MSSSTWIETHKSYVRGVKGWHVPPQRAAMSPDSIPGRVKLVRQREHKNIVAQPRAQLRREGIQFICRQ